MTTSGMAIGPQQSVLFWPCFDPTIAVRPGHVLLVLNHPGEDAKWELMRAVLAGSAIILGKQVLEGSLMGKVGTPNDEGRISDLSTLLD